MKINLSTWLKIVVLSMIIAGSPNVSAQKNFDKEMNVTPVNSPEEAKKRSSSFQDNTKQSELKPVPLPNSKGNNSLNRFYAQSYRINGNSINFIDGVIFIPGKGLGIIWGKGSLITDIGEKVVFKSDNICQEITSNELVKALNTKRKLDKIIISHIEIEEEPIPVAIKHLQAAGNKAVPAGQEVKINLQINNRKMKETVTMVLDNISLPDAVAFLCRNAGLVWKIDNDRIIINSQEVKPFAIGNNIITPYFSNEK